jgi:6-pyruvoyltetrahydropterin/6-carboxytetrahydropterin synthase
VPMLSGLPVTTEMLAVQIQNFAGKSLPVNRVRLHEREDFFAEASRDGEVFVGMQAAFNAAHRLHAATLSASENVSLYGKCNNPLGHGHQYFVEATVGGDFDYASGTLVDFGRLQDAIAGAVEPWQDRHLDLETSDFKNEPSTGENIVRKLWPRLDRLVGQKLVRLRLWETPNNKFTLRRT